MKLFVPELGTKLVLTKDWTFDLFWEQRNESLFPPKEKIELFPDEWFEKEDSKVNIYTYNEHPNLEITPEEFLKERGEDLPFHLEGWKPPIFKDFKRTSPWRFHGKGLCQRNGRFKDGKIVYEETFRTLRFTSTGTCRFIKVSIPHTIPAGTTLIVDRIYIRKGNEDFSSITFKMRSGKKILRFWAKLKDTENIEFELKE